MSKEQLESACAKNNYVVHPDQLPLCCPTDDMDIMEMHIRKFTYL